MTKLAVKRYLRDPKPKFRSISDSEEFIKQKTHSDDDLKAINRFRILNADEITELISLAQNTWLHPIFQTFAYSGARKNEVIKMQWSHVDLQNGLMNLYSKKESRQEQESVRTIPIHQNLQPVLLDQYKKTGHQEWVFLGPKTGRKLNEGSLGNAVRKLVKGTKFEGLGCHVFRYSFGSILAEKGGDSRHIGIFMAHRTEIMRQKYQQIFAEKTRELINMLEYGF